MQSLTVIGWCGNGRRFRNQSIHKGIAASIGSFFSENALIIAKGSNPQIRNKNLRACPKKIWLILMFAAESALQNSHDICLPTVVDRS